MSGLTEDIIKISNFINGQFIESKSHFNSYNPSLGRINALIPDSDANDVNNAVEAAVKAFERWSKTPASERSKLLNKIADLIDENASELALLESMDQGKTITAAITREIPRASHNFRHFATSVLNDVNMSVVEPESGIVNYTVRDPIGVAGIITPWNLPLYLLSFKIAPALAYGNTVVAKPSEMTSVTAFKLCQLIKDAGVPSGVVNMVFGYGKNVGEAIVTHPNVPLISFTGGTITGKRIATIAAPYFKKLSLELGGKNAAIVFDDVDLLKCLPMILQSAFFNQGEVCLSSSRIYVQKSIYDTFVKSFTEETLKLKVGNPLNKDTFMGALISKEHLERVNNYIEIAKKENGTVTSAKISLSPENQNGYFCPPTVVTNISDSSRCMNEEIFGPVTCIVPFDNEEEVIKRANSTDYGLSATIWSSSIDKVHRVAHQLKVGTVWCNCWLLRNLHMPFGGQKMSGVGREGSFDSREFYTQKKTVCIKINN